MAALATAPPAHSQQSAQRTPVKPYKAVTVALPVALKDQALEAFRSKVADLARKKDRAGFAKLVVPTRKNPVSTILPPRWRSTAPMPPAGT
jgi:hypothetical protein